MSIEDKRQALHDKTFRLMFRVLVIFGLPALAGYWVGKWVDTTYDMRPYGTLMVLGVTFAFSWALVIRMYLQITKEYRALEQEEQKQTK